MHYVSLIVEFLRGRPRGGVLDRRADAGRAVDGRALAVLFVAARRRADRCSPSGRNFALGSYLGPPLAFWLGEIAFRIAGMFGVYLLAQACVVVALWAVFALGRAIVGTRHAVLAVLLMVGVAAFNVPTPDFGPAVLAMPLWALALLHYWRALGEGARGYWFLLALDLGLLLLASYVGVILLALLIAFVPLTRARPPRDPAPRAVDRAGAAGRSWCSRTPPGSRIPARLVFSALDEGARNSSLPPWGLDSGASLLLSHLGVDAAGACWRADGAATAASARRKSTARRRRAVRRAASSIISRLAPVAGRSPDRGCDRQARAARTRRAARSADRAGA